MQWEGIVSWTLTIRQVSRDLWLSRPSPVIAHWVVYQQKDLQNWEWVFLATRDQTVMKRLPTYGWIDDHKGALPTTDWHLPRALSRTEQEGRFHLPLRRLNPVQLQLLAFNTCTESRVEWGTLCSRESGRTSHYIVGFFFSQKQILWSQSLHLLLSRKALNPFMMSSDLLD